MGIENLENEYEMAEHNAVNGHATYKLYNSRINSFIIVKTYPFGNCQNFTIAYFSQLVNRYGNSNVKEAIRKVKSICSILLPYLIIDIRKSVFDEVKDYLKIVSVSEYKNANGSNMALVIVDTRI